MGRLPKPSRLRILEGMAGHRPLNKNEPEYSMGVPDKPSGMSAMARKVWDGLVMEMAPSGVLRLVDALALAQLCEDQAMLDELRHGLAILTRDLAKKAKEKKQSMPGGALIGLARTNEGRRMFGAIRELSAQVIVQRREFGLTPSSSSRVNATGPGVSTNDPLERALCRA
jgi:phage terminase small subunit